MVSNCACGEDFRFEFCDLRTGRVRAVLHPIAADFQTELNGVGQGTITLATRDVLVRDIWPHLTSVYILRVNGGTATDTEPVVEFAGLIEEFRAETGGTTVVGVKSIEQYLHYRHMDDDFGRTEFDQNAIGAALVQRAETQGIPLTATFEPSAIRRDRRYRRWDLKNIGEAVEQLTNVINGPDWELGHAKDAGAWSTRMIFRDRVGADRDLVIRSDDEASDYSLTVDASNHATHVHGIGSGDEQDMLLFAANDPANIYPRFDAAPAWKDIENLPPLRDNTRGYLADHQEPIAVPEVSIPGMDPDPNLTRLGDTLEVRTNYGAVTYRGRVRIISRSWRLDAENPALRTFETIPLERASQTVLSQAPIDDNCEDGDC